MTIVIRARATPNQIDEMVEMLGIYIKLAVDIQEGILAGGGEWHADGKDELLKAGSQQSNIWGDDWYPRKQEIVYESLIN
jgi:hypothetical protein